MQKFALFLSLLVLSLAQEESKLTSANNHFGMRLFNQLPVPKGKNAFFSPYSVSTAMGMAYVGAKGGTQQDLYTGLGFENAGLPDNQVLNAYADHTRRLLSTPSNATLNVANAAVVHEQQTILETYRKALTDAFGAQVHNVDFVNNGKAAKDLINEWVKKNTRGKIETLLEEPLDADTKLVLLNAIYFKGIWQTEFSKKATRKSTFYNDGVTKNQVDTMFGTLPIRHGSFPNLNVDVAEFPYRGLDYSLVVLLPTEGAGVDNIKRKLTANDLKGFLSVLEERMVNVALPKFKLETKYSLKDALKGLGIRKVFQNDADLSGIGGKADLRVSDVIHKAVVEVNEEGSEAAAVTAVVVTRITGGADRSHRFIVDRPFLFFIRNKITNDILFAGQVNHL